MSEAALQEAVIACATLLGWEHFHAYDMRRSDTGWPDLLLLKPPRMLVLELKTERGKVSPEQEGWLALWAACGAMTAVIRPSDWHAGRVEALLR
jgi:hypothetical protein